MPESPKETADGLVTGVFAPIRLRMRNQGIAGLRRLRRIGRPEEMSLKKIQKINIEKTSKEGEPAIMNR